MQAEGPALAAALRERARVQGDLERLRGLAERRLRLRRLTQDPALSPERFRAACLRLLGPASTPLARLLEGLCVRVGLANQVAADGDTIDLAWDFEV